MFFLENNGGMSNRHNDNDYNLMSLIFRCWFSHSRVTAVKHFSSNPFVLSPHFIEISRIPEQYLKKNEYRKQRNSNVIGQLIYIVSLRVKLKIGTSFTC